MRLRFQAAIGRTAQRFASQYGAGDHFGLAVRDANHYLAFAYDQEPNRNRTRVDRRRPTGIRLRSRGLRRATATAPSALPRGGSSRSRGPGPGGGPRGAEPLVMDDASGFQPIFDGKTLTGWDGDPAFWKVADGAIVGQSTPENAVKENTFLIWRGGEPADFELKVQFRLSATNSGIQIRSVQIPQGTQVGNQTVQGKWVMKGYQADIDFANAFTGQIYEERAQGIPGDARAGRLCSRRRGRKATRHRQPATES